MSRCYCLDISHFAIPQIRRWEILQKELPKLRPDLGPAIRLSPEEQLLESFKQQGSWLDPESPDSDAKWQERAMDVLNRSIGGSSPERITPIKSGKNVVCVRRRHDE